MIIKPFIRVLPTKSTIKTLSILVDYKLLRLTYLSDCHIIYSICFVYLSKSISRYFCRDHCDVLCVETFVLCRVSEDT